MNSSFSLAYWLIPEELLMPILVLLVLLGLFLRLIGLRRIGWSVMIAAIGLIMLPVILGPILEEILMKIPTWMVVLVMVALGFYIIRLVLSVFLGNEGSGTLLAMAVAGGLRKMVRLPSLIAKWVRGLGTLLNSTSPGKRIIGMTLAIALALLAGLAGGQLDNSGLLPWSSSVDVAEVVPRSSQ